MAVKSNAFGSTTLTADDGRKFKNQITHGRAKDSAKASFHRGQKLVESFRASKELVVKLPAKT